MKTNQHDLCFRGTTMPSHVMLIPMYAFTSKEANQGPLDKGGECAKNATRVNGPANAAMKCNPTEYSLNVGYDLKLAVTGPPSQFCKLLVRLAVGCWHRDNALPCSSANRLTFQGIKELQKSVGKLPSIVTLVVGNASVGIQWRCRRFGCPGKPRNRSAVGEL